MTGGVILKMTYGIDMQEGEDPFVNLIEKANSNFNVATIPGAYLVDSFPLLRRLPEWLPGMGFMKTARAWAQETLDVVEVPYAFTKKQMVRFVLWTAHLLMFCYAGIWICSTFIHLRSCGGRRAYIYRATL